MLKLPAPAFLVATLVTLAASLGFVSAQQRRPANPPRRPAAPAPKPAPNPPPGQPAAGFAQVVQPFVREYCVKCHGPSLQRGNLRLDTLAANFSDPLITSKWAEVVRSINSRQMPPTNEKQPPAAAAARFVEWLERELAQAELAKRSTDVVLRRLNRAEYNNTIRDLVGVDFQPADRFPEDPPAGGFDNNGQALSMSPLQMELYYAAARRILDEALVAGPKPPSIKWRFDPEENTQGLDRYRVRRDGNNILLNPGVNALENGFTVVHHASWDRGIGFRDFRLAHPGEYILRFRAASRVPTRAEVVQSAARFLEHRKNREVGEDPRRAPHVERQNQADLQHFRTHRMYDYGPARVKITRHLGGTPVVVAEMDVDAPATAPKVYEVRTTLTTQGAGFEMEYAYSIPAVLENFWMQRNVQFPRPLLMVDWIELEGPIHPTWPPASHQRILFDSPNRGKDERAYAREVLERFMARAYRRPVTAAEVDARLALFTRLRAEKPTFEEAIKGPLAATLTSPHFLYLVEGAPEAGKSRKLTAYELASRLSYFLWSTMPDEELTRQAASGGLLKPDGLRTQVARMLRDPRSEAFVRNFAGQWLGLRKIGANPPAENLYPEYDRHLELSIARETEGFFAEILRHDLDARNLIKSDFVTINERLARFYGIPGVKGDQIRRVPVPAGVQRGGLVPQASILSVTSNGTRTSPVHRGVWILKTLLGADPGLPVANAGEIASQIPGVRRATVRQRLEVHRENPSCARCHDKIDPLGFALENFNAAGEWRDREGHGYQGRIQADDPLIDASARMPDGTEIQGVAGLQRELLKQEDTFLNHLASQMATYALGREMGFSDRPAIRAFTAEMKRNNYSLRSLVTSIVTSDLFTHR